MTLFRFLRGSSQNIKNTPLTDGYIYFCTDNGTLHFDHTDADGNLQRTQINAANAETLCGMTLEELKAYIDSPVIIDVTELPTDDIETGAFYRVNKIASTVTVYNGALLEDFRSEVRIVDVLPEIGDVYNLDNRVVYYQKSDETFYIFATSDLTGLDEDKWMTFNELISLISIPYGGIISSIEEGQEIDTIYCLVEYANGLYHYSDGWKEVGTITEEIVDAKIAEAVVQSDWEQADEAATDYIKNKPTLGALASKDVIGLVYDAENESLSIEYGVHLAPGEDEAVPVTEAHVHQIVDTAIEEEVKPLINEALVNYALKTDITTEERVNELIDAAINGALGGNY